MPKRGYKQTEEHKEKIRRAAKENGIGKWMLGRRFSEERIEKMREAAKKVGVGKWMLGKKHTEETKKKIGLAKRREKHPNWIKDRTKLVKKNQRNDYSYKDWVRKVKRRDKTKCRLQDKNCMGYKIVHHILPWSEYPKERYNINNGITLCQYHHPRKRDDEQRLMPVFQKLVKSNKY